VEIAKQGTTDERARRVAAPPLDAADTVAALDEGPKRTIRRARRGTGSVCRRAGAPPRGPAALETAAAPRTARRVRLTSLFASAEDPAVVPLLEHDVSIGTVAAGQCAVALFRRGIPPKWR